MTGKARVLYFLFLSSVAAVMVLVTFILASDQVAEVSIDEKMLVGGAFIACCLLCISMVFSPNWATKIVSKSARSRQTADSAGSRRAFVGHHPDCTFFNSHRVEIGDRRLCSGCLGLATGAIISLGLMVVYMASSSGSVSEEAGLTMLVLGLCAIFATYIETGLRIRQSVAHIALNGLMVIGFLLLVIGMLGSTGEIMPALLAVSFTFLWIDTRIELSRWSHSSVCRNCPQKCKSY